LPVALDFPHQDAGNLGFRDPRVLLPGILVVQGPPFQADAQGEDPAVAKFCAAYTRHDAVNAFPLIVVADDAEFTARNLDNFLWTTLPAAIRPATSTASMPSSTASTGAATDRW